MSCIDKLTYGEIKELMVFFGGQPQQNKSNLFEDVIGQYVIVRSRNEGINAGYLHEADETGCVLKECKRLWYHKPAVKFESWYEGVANYGLCDESKVSGAVEFKVILEDYSIVKCSDKATKSISEAKAHANS